MMHCLSQTIMACQDHFPTSKRHEAQPEQHLLASSLLSEHTGTIQTENDKTILMRNQTAVLLEVRFILIQFFFLSWQQKVES